MTISFTLSHHPRSHRPLLVYHRALEWIEERTAQPFRHVEQSLVVDKKARRPVRHHITTAPSGLNEAGPPWSPAELRSRDDRNAVGRLRPHAGAERRVCVHATGVARKALTTPAPSASAASSTGHCHAADRTLARSS